jgi:hypothetical protein
MQFGVGGSGAMWNIGQNETSFYFCMKQVLKLVSCKNRGMFHFAPCSTLPHFPLSMLKINPKGSGFESLSGHQLILFQRKYTKIVKLMLILIDSFFNS